MTAVETGLINVRAEMGSLVSNTNEILTFVKGANKVAGIAKKHWKTGIVFGAGAMTTLGIGNTAFWQYVGHFFSTM